MLKVACRWPGRDSHPQRKSYESSTLPLDHLHLQRHMGVNNLPRVATRQCAGWESNLQPLDHKSNAIPLYYRATYAFEVHLTLSRRRLETSSIHEQYCSLSSVSCLSAFNFTLANPLLLQIEVTQAQKLLSPHTFSGVTVPEKCADDGGLRFGLRRGAYSEFPRPPSCSLREGAASWWETQGNRKERGISCIAVLPTG